MSRGPGGHTLLVAQQSERCSRGRRESPCAGASEERCGHGSPRMKKDHHQGSREDARYMSLGWGGRPLRGCAKRVDMLWSPERAHAASDMGRVVSCGHAGKTHTVASCRGPKGAHDTVMSCHTQEKNLFPNAELNLLSPGSGCPLQAGTGHGRPGRAPGRC